MTNNSGLFSNMENGVLGVCFFSGFYVIVVCFCVSAIVPKVLKMFVFFPQFWVFFWGGFFLFMCVWKVWVFLCFLFLVFFLVLVLFLFV